MKKTYTAPLIETFDIRTIGYMCQPVLLGGSQDTESGFSNNGGDEAKQYNGFDSEDWPTYTAWED